MLSGYSTTPLAKKLGIKAGFKLVLIHQPAHYLELFEDLPTELDFLTDSEPESIDFIHLFCTKMAVLEMEAVRLKPLLKKDGLLWVSWPKGKSKIPTDLKREPIRELLLALGLVDVKVAAIDDDWSGLKFVYRLKDR